MLVLQPSMQWSVLRCHHLCLQQQRYCSQAKEHTNTDHIDHPVTDTNTYILCFCRGLPIVADRLRRRMFQSVRLLLCRRIPGEVFGMQGI